jgi:hypothetical protein
MNKQQNSAQAVGQMLRAVPGGAASQATNIEQSRAIAEVQAMVVVAQHHPRSEPDARNRVMESCKQLRLAERAFFRFKRGGQQVTGPSIHFAVELARCWGNINYGIKELGRDDLKGESEMIAYAWDVQTNTRAETSFIVPHKRDKQGGPQALTDMRDIYENNANNGARRLREMILRVLPPWLRVEAEDMCRTTLEKGESELTRPQKIARCLELYAREGVSKERLEAKQGKAEGWTEVDLANLGIILRSIRNGETNAEDEFPSTNAAEVGEMLQPAEQKAPEPEAKEAGEAKRSPTGFRLICADGKEVTPNTAKRYLDSIETEVSALGTISDVKSFAQMNEPVFVAMRAAGQGEIVDQAGQAIDRRIGVLRGAASQADDLI